MRAKIIIYVISVCLLAFLIGYFYVKEEPVKTVRFERDDEPAIMVRENWE